MRIRICTVRSGYHGYRISVFENGVFQFSVPATVGTVTNKRNQLCDQLSEVADEVQADAIPPIPGMKRGNL